MAYATDNPIKKIAEAGGNSVFFYIDGDAVSYTHLTLPTNREV